MSNSEEEKDLPLPKGFIVMFAGNLGEAQNLENVMKAALLTKTHTDIHWVFLGDGRKKAWIDKFIADNDLHATVHMLGRKPIYDMPAYFAKADVMLVALRDEVIFNLTLPAKVQAYMSKAKPIICFANGETSDIVRTSGCGWCVPADGYNKLASEIIGISGMPKDELIEKGKMGLAYYQCNFTREICMDRIEMAMNNVRHKR